MTDSTQPPQLGGNAIPLADAITEAAQRKAKRDRLVKRAIEITNLKELPPADQLVPWQ